MLIYSSTPSDTHHHRIKRGSRRKAIGRGVVNKLINKLPFELHIPGYQYCGPGTKLAKRLSRGDKGINPLDQACREHDIFYSQYKDTASRHKADRVLAERTWERVKSKNASVGEKAAAWAVTNAMKLETNTGMSLERPQQQRKRKRRPRRRRQQQQVKRGGKISLKGIINRVVKALKDLNPLGTNPSTNVKTGLALAKRYVREAGGKHRLRRAIPRVLPVPKTGGFIFTIPAIFGALSAIGALSGGAAGIAKAVNDAKAASKKLDESKRHNKKMEELAAATSTGHGLYLKPYRSGLGLYFMRPNRTGKKKFFR